MADIRFNLTSAADLDCMVAQPTINGGWMAGNLPPGMLGSGMYLIWNRLTNNRYAGVSGNLQNRFQKRYETITECGFPTNAMREIVVFWGGAQSRDTPAYNNQNPAWVQVQNHTNHVIDNISIDPERILIAFIMRHFTGGTVTNNVKVGLYGDPGLQNNIMVTLNWGASNTIQAGSHNATWAPGNNF
ncbi:MAG: hypothetical protein B7Z80_13110 [Rhodospirillales bacterium 20-64-7]|nr:MAG: hypothetical protein B7Z80_13110 [Rhodospirillales bacterium 20-64-7]HQT75626.1 hypothetical protein [Rhodopila sp.]